MNISLFNTLVPALLHTLWIGLIAAAGLFLALQAIPSRRAKLRYALSIAALMSLFLGGLVVWELPEKPAPQTARVTQPSHIETAPVVTSQPQFKAKPRATVEQKQSHANWRQWLGIAWMAGAAISLFRLIRISVGIRSQIRRSLIVETPAVIRLTAELAKVAGISRRILLLTGEHIVQPAVTGIFRPAIFLPLSALTGLPEWQLRAVLAHEIAHIARHDFLVNALQLLTETVLFFNPAAWWIHRRIREEREACCDALAARWIDSSHELAETLIEQAATTATPLPAFGDSGTVKSRIQRLLGQQPHLRLPWKSLLLVTLFATAGLIVAHRGTAEAVGYVKRLQKLQAARNKYETQIQKIRRKSVPALKNMWLELAIKTEGGKPVPLPLLVEYTGNNGISTIYANVAENNRMQQPNQGLERFKINVSQIAEYGYIETISIQANGYSQYSGIGGAADTNGIIRAPPVTLTTGFAGQVHFTDPSGNPVSNLQISASEIVQEGGYSISPKKPVKGNGTFTVSNCLHRPFLLQIDPPDGFAYEERRITFQPGKTYEWVLSPASLFSGTVVDPNGSPISDAAVYLFKNEPLSLLRIPGSPIEAYTDEQGAFSFSRMRLDKEYTLAVYADGYFGKFVQGQTLSDQGKKIVLNPGGTLTVCITNLTANTYFYCQRAYTYVDDSGGQSTAPVPEEWSRRLSKTKTQALYEFRHIWEGKNYLSMNDVHYSLNAPFTNDTQILDVAQLREEQRDPNREPRSIDITIQLIPPSNEPLPEGTFTLQFSRKYMREKIIVSIPDNGIIQTNIMMNPSSSLHICSDHTPGYFIGGYERVSLDTVDMTCRIVPAGAAALTCVDTEGRAVMNYRISVESRGGQFNSNHLQDIWSRQPDSNTCMVESLAFDSKFRLHISKYRPKEIGGPLEYTSKWFSVSKQHPVKEITCVLKPVQ